jgi:hypothetical protein
VARPLFGAGPAFLLAVVLAACQAPGFASASPAAVTTRDPGEVACPDGKSAKAGLQNFGAYIGTWDANRPRDPTVTSDYVIGIIAGHVSVRCSTDDFVVVEQIHPQFQAPAGTALRVALTELPDDSEKVYDHTHASCRVLQYSSRKLARQLGADDTDGRVDIVFTSESAAYNSAAVKTIILDLGDRLGADARAC